MAGRVEIPIQATGIEAVRAQIRSVKHSFIELDKEALASSDAASKKRIALLRAESRIKLALLREEEQEKVRAERSAAKAAADSARAQREHAKVVKEFDRMMGRSGGSLGGGGAGGGASAALMRGEGFSGMVKSAGATGLALGALATVVGLASSALRQFSSFLLNDVIKPAMALETRSVQIANNSGGALTAAQVQDRARAIGLRNNMDPNAVLEATGRFQDLTGEPALGFDILNTVATISKARGYDTKSLSELAAAAYRPGMKAGDLNQLLLTLTGQGEKGSIPIGELARLGGRLTAPAQKFGGDAFTQITTANALLQTAKRTGFGTVEDAATGLQNFTQEALLKGRMISPKSFASVNGVDTILDPVRYLGDIFRRTRGSAMALHGMGFSEPAQKFIGAYQGIFSQGFSEAKAAGKSDAEARDMGANAVEAFVNQMKMQTSTMEGEEKRRNAVLRTSGERWDAAINQLKDKLLIVMPSVDRFVTDFVAMGPQLTEAALTLANALIWMAGIVHDIMKPFASTDEQAAGPGKRGSYQINPETGKFEFMPDSANKFRDPTTPWATLGGGPQPGAPARPPEMAVIGPPTAPPTQAPLTPAQLAALGHDQAAAAGPVTPGSKAAQDEAAQGHKEVAKAAGDATEALKRLAEQLKNTPLGGPGGLPRAQPFTFR